MDAATSRPGAATATGQDLLLELAEDPSAADLGRAILRDGERVVIQYPIVLASDTLPKSINLAHLIRRRATELAYAVSDATVADWSAMIQEFVIGALVPLAVEVSKPRRYRSGVDAEVLIVAPRLRTTAHGTETAGTRLVQRRIDITDGPAVEDLIAAARGVAQQRYTKSTSALATAPGRLDWPGVRAEIERRATEWRAQYAGAAARVPVVRCAADVEVRAVSWVWWPYLPAGHVTLLAGDPGTGKTWAALALAAAVSQGTGIAGGPTVEQGGVVYVSYEDGLADTLRPRLDAVGADLRRVYLVEGVRDPEGRMLPMRPEDVPGLVAVVRNAKARLLVVDPVQAFVGGGTDLHRANEVRAAMEPLRLLAEQASIAVLVLAHLRKGSEGRAIHRLLGSVDFVALARSVLIIGEAPENPGLRVIAQAKSSLAPAGANLAFSLTEGRLEWVGDPPQMDADTLLGNPATAEDRSALAEAQGWLATELGDGPRSAGELTAEARAAGISAITLRRAREALDVRLHKEGGHGKGWQWSLPIKDDHLASRPKA